VFVIFNENVRKPLFAELVYSMLKKYGTLIWRSIVTLLLAVAFVSFLRKGQQVQIIIFGVLLAFNLVFWVITWQALRKRNRDLNEQ
jgi:membrane protein DedA with SNARE-associated domain